MPGSHSGGYDWYILARSMTSVGVDVIVGVMVGVKVGVNVKIACGVAVALNEDKLVQDARKANERKM